MKKIILLLIILVILAVGVYFWQNFKGVWFAVKSPSRNIVEIIENLSEKNNISETSESILPPDFPLNLPKGFSISIFAKGLGKSRVMAYDPAGNLIISLPDSGKVVALPDKDGNGQADEIITVIEKLNNPHGLATYCRGEWADSPYGHCKLYIAEEDQVAFYDYDEKNLKALNKKKIIDLSSGGRHITRSILFEPFPNQDKLLISVGSSCDVCYEKDNRRAVILEANYDGSDLKVFAKGLRNSVFMNIHPVTGKIWATDMGRDWLGDNLPPDEINIIEKDKNYGWPICYGKNIHDTKFDKSIYKRNPCMEPFETSSYIDIPAHSSSLGLAFFPEEGWPQEYWHNLLVAYHGSWNRSEPTGYKIVRYKLDENGRYISEEDFIIGWLNNNEVLGRPVDILIQPGGVIFVSDDKAGVIYKVKYTRDKINTNPLNKLNLIKVFKPISGEIVKSPLVIEGEARGNWFFEASFPVKILDANGRQLGVHYAQAEGDWMTAEFVPYKSVLEFKNSDTENGFLILEKDNPSGLPEFDDQIKIPVRFK